MMQGFRDIPGVEKQVLAAATPVAPKHSEASAITLKDGSILLLWTEFLNPDLLPENERPPASAARRAATSDDGYARVSGIVSSDGGRTWSAPRVVVDDHDALINCMSPSLTRLPDGRLLLAYSWRCGGNHLDNAGLAAKRVRFSDDEGATWSDPIQITPQDGGYHTGCHDRAYTLPSGRVLVQCHTLHAGPGKKMSNYVARTDDHGATWALSNMVTEPVVRGFEEASIVQRADSSLLMIMRSWRGQAYYTESTDEGATWGEAYPASIIAPDAPSLLTKLPGSDDLLLVWNSNYVPGAGHDRTRCPLLCAISQDGGRRWEPPKAIEVDPTYEWAYPGLLYHDGYALLHYFRCPADRSHGRELVLARIPLDWFRDPRAT